MCLQRGNGFLATAVLPEGAVAKVCRASAESVPRLMCTCVSCVCMARKRRLMQFCRNLIWLENLGRALLLNRARVGSWSELKLALESLYRARPLPSLKPTITCTPTHSGLWPSVGWLGCGVGGHDTRGIVVACTQRLAPVREPGDVPAQSRLLRALANHFMTVLSTV
jgi:hypothetical protein